MTEWRWGADSDGGCGSGAMADLEKNPLAKLIDWFSTWKVSFNQLQEHIGWVARA